MISSNKKNDVWFSYSYFNTFYFKTFVVITSVKYLNLNFFLIALIGSPVFQIYSILFCHLKVETLFYLRIFLILLVSPFFLVDCLKQLLSDLRNLG